MVTIAHASVPTAEDRAPFEHGLALAERAGAKLLSVHANDDPSVEAQMLDAADVLRGWGHATAVEHEKLVHNCCDDPVDTLLDALREAEPDLVVAATHQRKGVIRVLFESRAEAIAENVKVPTLLVPLDGEGFVTPQGELDLRRLLIPVGDSVAAKVAIERATWFVDMARAEDVEVTLLHVGEEGSAPRLTLPDHPRIRWTQRTVPGVLEEVIGEEAADACAIVMATRGHDTLGDMVRGSHTERVLRRVHCPLLSVPVPGH
ncbi:MAG TPA: universal stress protein [Sandaracinaceae bacterium LLY-WYZ-13_1]|nr:universal stress protein [Sandaracinaceae bacterium LLY-WYZ-13_1]